MKNRIAMAGHIEPCWLFVYRGPEGSLRSLLPQPLNLVTKGGYAFVNVVICKLSHMRPAFMPIRAGLSYWHIAYRLYAESHGQQGLYFLRSDANSSMIVKAGNLLTDFRFNPAQVEVEQRDAENQIRVQAPGASVTASINASRRSG